MKQSTIQGFLVGMALSVGYVQPTFADVAPPDGYVEQCTVAKQQGNGNTCIECPNDYRSFATDAGDPCKLQYEGQGYTKACNSYGASVWTEVWCRGGATDAGSTVTPPAGGCSGCRTNTKHANGPIAALLMLGAVLTTCLVARRVRS